MSYTFEQFIRFTTDSVGLERTFRLFQAIAQILSSFALPFDLLIYLVGLTAYGPPSPTATQFILLALRQRLALTRRFFRLFRFLESFNGAQKLYAAVSTPQAQREPAKSGWVQSVAWFDIFGRTFNGMYLLLEASTIIDSLQIEGLTLWTPDWEHRITIEGQRFWLFSLVCGVFSGLLKMIQVLAYTPVPDNAPVTATGESNSQEKQESVTHPESEKSTQDEKDSKEGWDLKQEQQRLRGIVKGRKQGRVAWRREIRQKINKLGRGVIANALDITLPGSVVGWVRVDTGTVGVATFITTILTGMEVWERCGQEVASGS